MNKKIIILVAVIILLIISIFIGWLTTLELHWSMQEIKDTKSYSLNLDNKANDVKSTFQIANRRVNEWRSGTYLDDIMIEFVGTKQIKNREGLFRYFYYISNEDEDGLPHVVAIVDINTEKQVISRFEVFGGFDLEGRKLDISEWKVDILEAMDIAEKHLGTDYYDKNETPKVRIRASYGNYWIVEFHPNEESYMPDKYIDINAITGEVVKIKD